MLEGVLKGTPKKKKATSLICCFNPWYVGGGVKRQQSCRSWDTKSQVSILGMLEGVLKDSDYDDCQDYEEFQSLVCWRGC